MWKSLLALRWFFFAPIEQSVVEVALNLARNAWKKIAVHRFVRSFLVLVTTIVLFPLVLICGLFRVLCRLVEYLLYMAVVFPLTCIWWSVKLGQALGNLLVTASMLCGFGFFCYYLLIFEWDFNLAWVQASFWVIPILVSLGFWLAGCAIDIIDLWISRFHDFCASVRGKSVKEYDFAAFCWGFLFLLCVCWWAAS